MHLDGKSAQIFGIKSTMEMCHENCRLNFNVEGVFYFIKYSTLLPR